MPTLDLGRVIPLERGTWTTGTSYEFMDSVQYEGSTYVSIFSGTHTAADANKPTTALGQSTYWRRNARGFEPKGTYNANTAYERDNLVDYGGSVYRCIANTTAGTDPSNGNYWTSFAQGIGEYLGEWNSNDTYAEGSIVIWDVDAGNNINGLFRANQPTPQNTPPSNSQYWDVLASGFVWQGEWTTGTAYKYRSVVSYRGGLYLAAAITGVVADQNPTALVDWTKISDGFKWVGSLESIGSGTSLFYGDVVTFANGLFQVVNSTNGADDPRQTPANFRTLTKWWDWQGAWNNSTVYYLDQTLIYQNSIYRVLGTTTAGQNPDNANSLFQTIIEAPDNFTDYSSATKRLQIRRVTQATNDAATYANGEPVAITDGSGNATGALYIHDGTTQGGKVSSAPEVLVPTGAIFAFGMTSNVPTGYLVCNGGAISRTSYASLFAAIGTTWGSGDGSTTFNLPDLRGAFLRGEGTGTINSRNKAAGGLVGTYQEDHFQGHGHNMRIYTGTASYGPKNGDNNNFTNTVPIREPVELDNYGPVRYGNETYPYNATVKYCIKY
jgi:microcystin-dependent protein